MFGSGIRCFVICNDADYEQLLLLVCPQTIDESQPVSLLVQLEGKVLHDLLLSLLKMSCESLLSKIFDPVRPWDLLERFFVLLPLTNRAWVLVLVNGYFSLYAPLRMPVCRLLQPSEGRLESEKLAADGGVVRQTSRQLYHRN